MHVLQTKNYIDTSTSFLALTFSLAICLIAISYTMDDQRVLYLKGENLEVVWAKFSNLS
jgi:hypothetical protein